VAALAGEPQETAIAAETAIKSFRFLPKKTFFTLFLNIRIVILPTLR